MELFLADCDRLGIFALARKPAMVCFAASLQPTEARPFGLSAPFRRSKTENDGEPGHTARYYPGSAGGASSNISGVFVSLRRGDFEVDLSRYSFTNANLSPFHM